MTNPKIAILIPVHNGLNFTQKCLQNIVVSLRNLSVDSGRFKVIVIDDGSTDHTSEWIKANYPETIVLTGDGHLWWSGGINKGITYALNSSGCDYTLWWNNDIHCTADYFNEILTLIKETPTNTVIGSKIYFADEHKTIWSMGGVFDPRSGKKYTIGMNETDSEKFNKVTDADWLPGMGTLVHRSVFEKTGLVNEKDFPQYHGDSDFTYRAKLDGFNIKVFPKLKIWNDKSNSGLLHYNSLKMLVRSLHDIKSNYHIGKDLLFYRRYITSPFAYRPLVSKYFFYIGGFMKWKILISLGIQKKSQTN
ncbi:MAG: glycosyltransferase family 2 protein [Bacteroidales bacterium]|nr:glycosyltransferase family 2 protein [Bacteroidales bacterium]